LKKNTITITITSSFFLDIIDYNFVNRLGSNRY